MERMTLSEGHAAFHEIAVEQARRERAEAICEVPTGEPVRMPCPDGLDPMRWAQLDRRTRRALWRHHLKLQRRR